MSGWKIIRIGGSDFFIKSSQKKPLRSPIRHKGRTFVREKGTKKIHGTPLIRTREIRASPRPRTKVVVRKRLTGVDIENLKKIADRHHVDRDLFDWKAHIDRRISYYENKTAITRKIRDISKDAASVRASSVRVMTGNEYHGRIHDRVDTLEFEISKGLNHTRKQELAGWKAQLIKIKT